MIFRSYLLRKAYKGPYIPAMGSGRPLSTYSRSMRNSFGAREKSGSIGFDPIRSMQLGDEDVINVASSWRRSNAQQKAFEDFVEEILENLTDNPDLNPGQIAILESLQNDSKKRDTVRKRGKNFSEDAFNDLGDDKFNAVSDTLAAAQSAIEAAAEEAFGNPDTGLIAATYLSGSFARLPFNVRINFTQSARGFVQNLQNISRMERLNAMRRSMIRGAFRSNPLSDYTPDRIFGSYKSAVFAWREGGIARFAKGTGRTMAEAKSMYGGKEYRSFNLKENIKQLNNRGVYLPSQLSGQDRINAKQRIQETRNQTTYWGSRW